MLGNQLLLLKLFRASQQVVQSSTRTLIVSAHTSGQYNPTYHDPDPDPDSYVINESDDLLKVKLKAAPSSQNYSAFYDQKLYNFQKHVLKQGKEALASKIMRETLEHIKCVQLKKYNSAQPHERSSIEVNPLKIFHTALDNVKPIVGVKRLTKGAQSYQVPYPLTPEQQFFMMVKWMLNYVRSGKPNTPAAIRLGNELLAAYHGEGVAMKRKQELHKLAEANRAYAHFRWKKSLESRAGYAKKTKKR